MIEPAFTRRASDGASRSDCGAPGSGSRSSTPHASILLRQARVAHRTVVGCRLGDDTAVHRVRWVQIAGRPLGNPRLAATVSRRPTPFQRRHPEPGPRDCRSMQRGWRRLPTLSRRSTRRSKPRSTRPGRTRSTGKPAGCCCRACSNTSPTRSRAPSTSQRRRRSSMPSCSSSSGRCFPVASLLSDGRICHNQWPNLLTGKNNDWAGAALTPLSTGRSRTGTVALDVGD